MIKNETVVDIYSQDFEAMDDLGIRGFKADWNLPRRHTLVYSTDKTGLEAAHEAYEMLNAPPSLLTQKQKHIASTFKAHSLSVGDIVKCGGIQYLCAPMGWLERRIA